MVDMHCPANVTLIAGGVEPGHANGHGRKASLGIQRVLQQMKDSCTFVIRGTEESEW